MFPVKIKSSISNLLVPHGRSGSVMMEWWHVVFMQPPGKNGSITVVIILHGIALVQYVPSTTVQSAPAFTVSTQRWSQNRSWRASPSLRWKTNGALWGQTDSSSSSCNSSVSPWWLLSRNYFLHDLRHGERDGRGGTGRRPRSSGCQRSRSVGATRTPADWR